MTLADLILARNFLTKLVVRGVEEDQLVALVAKIDAVLIAHSKPEAA
jgi:hypothetical protein